MRRRERLTNREILAPFELAARLMPRRLQRWMGWPVGLLLYLLLPEPRAAVARNLATIGGGRYSAIEIRRLVLRTLRHYGQYLLDYMILPHLGDRGLGSLIVRIDGRERLTRALEEGRGAIIATPHLGHWELGGALLASQGYPICVATAPERDPRVRAVRESMRRRIGVRSVTIGEEGGLSMVPLLAALRQNQVVALLADRVVSGASVEVPFFGRPTRFPAGPAILARASGAPIVPVYITLNKKWTYEAVAEEPFRVSRTRDRDADLRAATERLARRFEAEIARHPDQWYNFFEFWSAAEQPEASGHKTL